MRDEWVIYVTGHPLLSTRFPWCIHLRNDLCFVWWGIKLYLLTQLYCLLTHLWPGISSCCCSCYNSTDSLWRLTGTRLRWHHLWRPSALDSRRFCLL